MLNGFGYRNDYICVKFTAMIIERVENNKIVITMSSDVDIFGIQRLIDYGRYLEATSQSKVKQADIDKLADEVNDVWWNQNKHRFSK
jgi:hypothetical protein